MYRLINTDDLKVITSESGGSEFPDIEEAKKTAAKISMAERCRISLSEVGHCTTLLEFTNGKISYLDGAQQRQEEGHERNKILGLEKFQSYFFDFPQFKNELTTFFDKIITEDIELQGEQFLENLIKNITKKIKED